MLETSLLETTWFVIWCLLWAIYFTLDGFDLGMGTMMPFLAKTETEKRVMYNAAGPFWDGNEVWLITAGGVTFAAFPTVYAVMFSALYAPLLILLFALIFRAVSYEFRAKKDCPKWRKMWDIFNFIGNFVPALLLGVAFANLFKGIPIDGQGVYHGNILLLLNPYGLVGGLFFVCMFAVHGCVWLGIKSDGDLNIRTIKTAYGLWFIECVLLALFLVLTYFYTNIFDNYLANHIMLIIPALVVIGLLAIPHFLYRGKIFFAWLASGVFIISTTFFGVLGMFPNMLISNIDQAFNITAYNGSSSELTLYIMLIVACTCVPVVITYQAWVYYTFSYKITAEELKSDHAY